MRSFPAKMMNRITRLKPVPYSFRYHLQSFHARSNQLLSKKLIDLRSDTVTKPSKEMLQVMRQADVGDDVYKEDNTVNKLEETCAHLFGMESALFVPSGTMGNLICVMCHVKRRGEEVIIGCNQHAYDREGGHFIQFASIPVRVLPNKPDGTICLKEISKNNDDGLDFHSCKTKLMCVENTHMRAGGIPLSVEYMQQIGHLARSNNICIHVDGARLYNASVALHCKVSDLLLHADSVSMCLSKGIGCPIGSVIGGTKEFIEEAKRVRKGLGGEMRQLGFLAAAGIYALEDAPSVLLADHKKARRLAEGIKYFKGMIDVDLKNVRTNILITKTKDDVAPMVVQILREHGVLCSAFDTSTIRFVTHKDISDNDISKVLESIHLAIQLCTEKL